MAGYQTPLQQVRSCCFLSQTGTLAGPLDFHDLLPFPGAMGGMIFSYWPRTANRSRLAAFYFADDTNEHFCGKTNVYNLTTTSSETSWLKAKRSNSGRRIASWPPFSGPQYHRIVRAILLHSGSKRRPSVGKLNITGSRLLALCFDHFPSLDRDHQLRAPMSPCGHIGPYSSCRSLPLSVFSSGGSLLLTWPPLHLCEPQLKGLPV